MSSTPVMSVAKRVPKLLRRPNQGGTFAEGGTGDLYIRCNAVAVSSRAECFREAAFWNSVRAQRVTSASAAKLHFHKSGFIASLVLKDVTLWSKTRFVKSPHVFVLRCCSVAHIVKAWPRRKGPKSTLLRVWSVFFRSPP